MKATFRSYYCDEFSEKYLLYKTLNYIFKNKYKVFTGVQIKALGIEAEPDYYIRNGNFLFLFESKDILINAKIKATYDFQLYEKEFIKKLYFEENNGKIEKKAVLQLINNIKRVLKKDFSFDVNYKEHLINIYPIIVVHDRQFNVAGLNVLVNHWFKTELEKIKLKGININKVKPITLIDIDTFIYHQDIFRDKTIRLEKVIDEYFKFITINTVRRYKDEEHLLRYAKRTVVPFSIFLSNYVGTKKNKQVPKMLLEKGIGLFK